MYQFTPWSALLGGLCIGLSAALLWWLNGRIAGISGILSQAMARHTSERLWRWLFLLGMVAGAGAYVWLTGSAAAQTRGGFPIWLLIVAGLLTGYGTSMANGCTSGHGVCGLGRLSLRSLVATLIFLVVAVVTTGVVRHLLKGLA